MTGLARLLLGFAVLMPLAAEAQTAAPQDAYLYLISPREGQKVRGPITVRFGLRNMGVTRAGDTTANVGHHHLLVDTDASSLPPGEPIATDRKHLHFGGGQTETTLELSPGRHTLQLVFGDAEHKQFNPPVVSKKITIMVLAPIADKTSRR